MYKQYTGIFFIASGVSVLNIKTSFDGGVLRLLFEGELDHHAAKKAAAVIEDSINIYLPKSCVIDFAKLAFMDSSGIAVILKTYRRMNEICGKISVENAGRQPLRVLDAAGIDRLIKISTEA